MEHFHKFQKDVQPNNGAESKNGLLSNSQLVQERLKTCDGEFRTEDQALFW
jgi:hypothetical protein